MTFAMNRTMTMSNEPVEMVKGTLRFTWAGVVLVAVALAAFARQEVRTEAQGVRLTAVETETRFAATKSDVQDLRARIDRVLELMADERRVTK